MVNEYKRIQQIVDTNPTRSDCSISQSALASTAIRKGSSCSASPLAWSRPCARLAGSGREDAACPTAGSTNVTA